MRGTAPELQLHLASSRAAASPRPPRPVSFLAGASMDRKSKSTKGSASSAAASMAALAAAAAAGDSSSDTGAAVDGALPRHGEEDNMPAKMAAVGDASGSSPVAARRGVAAGGAASSSSPVPVAARRGAAAASIAAGGGGPRCQAERCNANLMTDEKPYNRRHKVCEAHSKAPVVLVAGLRQRFCQQCSRFHELSEFDDIKRSCRLRLAGHNERRRKSSADAHGGGGNGFRQHADQNGPAGNHFQIR